MQDVRAVVWKEWREICASSRGRRDLGLVVLIAAIGIYLPIEAGAEWVESPLYLFTWAWLPALLAGTPAADSFAGERERHTLETLLSSRLPDRAIFFGKLAALAAYAVAITWIVMFVGLVTVNFAHGQGGLILYSPLLIVGNLVVSILSAAMAAGFGALVSLTSATVRQAQQLLGRLPLVLVLLLTVAVKLTPDAWESRAAAAILAGGAATVVAVAVGGVGILALVVIRLAVARFKRSGMILD